jgi:hypothetical protein
MESFIPLDFKRGDLSRQFDMAAIYQWLEDRVDVSGA